MTTQEAIEVLKDAKYIGSDEYASEYDREMSEAIDTVVAELEKPLQTDEQMKKRGNLTCRVMLRQLNCKHENNHVTISVKELQHWFETGQHLKEWKEWDTI